MFFPRILVSLWMPRFKKKPLDKYLDFNSHHPIQNKRSVLNTLLERAEKVPSTSAGKRKEKKHVVKVLMSNNYSLRFIKSCDSQRKAKHDTNSNSSRDEVQTSFVVLPYVTGVTERVSNVLSNNGVKVGFQPCSTRCALASQDQSTNSPHFSPDVWYTKLITLTVTLFTMVKSTEL